MAGYTSTWLATQVHGLFGVAFGLAAPSDLHAVVEPGNGCLESQILATSASCSTECMCLSMDGTR